MGTSKCWSSLKFNPWPFIVFNYINYLSSRLSSNPKLSADGTSVVGDMILSANALNNDLLKIND